LKQQVFVVVDGDYQPDTAVEMAKKLSDTYSKEICLLSIANNESDEERCQGYLNAYKTKLAEKSIFADTTVVPSADEFTSTIEAAEASMLVFEITPNSSIRKMLKLCRELRTPYFFCKPGMKIAFDKILVPVNYLIEEREKGPFSSSFGRFFKSKIMLMTAKDYGSKAKETTEAIATLLDHAGVEHSRVEAKKDSFKIEFEAVEKSAELGADLLICSASRDYGLDDIVFGPKEQKVLKKSNIPVMLINPRGDLYSLCG
jgi:nucleotide-binding universal stress UspA family protein